MRPPGELGDELMRDEEKICCYLDAQPEGGFVAFAEGAPILARGESLAELRRNLAAAVRAFFGHERPTALLVGGTSVGVRRPPGRGAVAP